ncbi:MAG: flagellar export protein FliJ [Spirochaetales bacterium]|nr:flagellar export protein FliJ [Spirochaetales bacterium]
MKRFQFPLERVLQMRRHTEREWELRLAEISGECMVIQNNIQFMEKQKQLNLEDLAKYSNQLSFELLQSHQLFADKLVQEIKTKTIMLEQKEKKRQEIQKKYIEASQKRKVLEKLKEKRQDEYYQEELRAAFKEMDDLTTQKYARNLNLDLKGE